MPEHVNSTIGDRTHVLVPSVCIEPWTNDAARWRLQQLAHEWLGRDALLAPSPAGGARS